VLVQAKDEAARRFTLDGSRSRILDLQLRAQTIAMRQVLGERLFELGQQLGCDLHVAAERGEAMEDLALAPHVPAALAYVPVGHVELLLQHDPRFPAGAMERHRTS
jgi:hypothetical protein